MAADDGVPAGSAAAAAVAAAGMSRRAAQHRTSQTGGRWALPCSTTARHRRRGYGKSCGRQVRPWGTWRGCACARSEIAPTKPGIPATHDQACAMPTHTHCEWFCQHE